MSEIDPADVLKFQAQIKRVSTTADGGINITLECGQDALVQAGRLSLWAAGGRLLAAALTPIEDE